MGYRESWLRELQLYDKSMVFYQAQTPGNVKLCYRMKRKGREELGYHSETLMPVLENLYVKQYVLYGDESMSCYFQEKNGKQIVTSETQVVEPRISAKDGKYGKINAMTRMSSPAKKEKAVRAYREEERMADRLFKIY